MQNNWKNVVIYDENYDTPVLIMKCETEDIAVDIVDRIGNAFQYAHVDITEKDYPMMPVEDRLHMLNGTLTKEGKGVDLEAVKAELIQLGEIGDQNERK